MFGISDIFSGGVEGIFKGVSDVVKTFKADPLEVLKLEHAIKEAQMSAEVAMAQAQTKINEVEAGSERLFVSGWRPAIGWICATGLFYTFVLQPLLEWGSTNFSLMPPPHLDSGVLVSVVTGLLGLAGYRTYEKVQGVAKS